MESSIAKNLWRIPATAFLLVLASCRPGPSSPYGGAVLPTIPAGSTSITLAAVGDAGTGRAQQIAVAAALSAYSIATPIDFVLYPGDNFYEDGVVGTDDPQWDTAFSGIYDFANLPLFYPVMGNHDHRSPDPSSQVSYSDVHPSWCMPAHYYAYSYQLDGGESVLFLALDTVLLLNPGEERSGQLDFVDRELTKARDAGITRIIAYGHHPIFSTGVHGDNPTLRSLLEHRFSTGSVDLYIAGHDHDIQVFDVIAGTRHIVSGAGGKRRAVPAPADAVSAFTPLYTNHLQPLDRGGAVILHLDEAGYQLVVLWDDGNDPFTISDSWNEHP